MSSARFDIEKFTGMNDFSLWKVKMHAILVQQGLAMALESESKMPDTLTKVQKTDILQKAHSSLILSLGDKPLREVAKETNAAAIWSKLESLYMTKSLANRLYMKQHLYSYKMNEEKDVLDQLEEFNMTVDELETIDENKIGDEDRAILLLILYLGHMEI